MSIPNLLKAFEEYSKLRKNKLNFFSNSSIIIGNNKSGSTMLFNFLADYTQTYHKIHYAKEYKIYLDQIKKSKYLKNLDISSNNVFSLNCYLLAQEFFHDDDSLTWNHALDTILELIINEKPNIYYGFRSIGRNFLKYKTKLRDKNIIFLIRDPRDCAVSSYFSYLKTQTKFQNTNLSDSLGRNKSLELNNFVKGEGIDSCINELNFLTAFLQANVKFYKYEDFWFNKKEFCLDILNRIEMPIDNEIFLRIFDRQVEPDSSSDQRKSGHLRNGMPGEYKEKLSKETIDLINKKCAFVLELYKYS